ncbi:MAG: glycosyltransferase family 4 protein, partial [Candidatus Hydrogenedens sp.]
VRISIPSSNWNVNIISEKVCRLIQKYKPSLIFLQHGYLIKIPISKNIKAVFSDIPIISRTFAHELFCLRSPLRFKDNKHCPKNIFKTPDYCLQCSLEGLKKELLSGMYNTWTKDYIQSKSFSWSFLKSYLHIVKKWKKVIVYNKDLQTELLEQGIDTVVIPGGIEKEYITGQPAFKNNQTQEKIIFMAGRCDDPSKGMGVLYEAGNILYQKRKDFKIYVTSFNLKLYNDWFLPLGWLSREELFNIYRQSDICVIPSHWAEPFGITALEAMALGKAVIASKIGGLKETILDNQNGLLFEPGNPLELSEKLNLLLNNPQIKMTLGKNARKSVLENYIWDIIIDKYYLPLIEDVLSKEK